MKKIYKQYCNDIQNPALGAFLIYTFANLFYKRKKDYVSLLDIFIFIPLIMVKETREILYFLDANGKSHKTTKISKFYEKIGYIGKLNSNLTLGTINGVIIRFREFIMASIVFAIDTKLIELTSKGYIKPRNIIFPSCNLNKELSTLEGAVAVLAKIYADDTDLNKAVKNLEIVL